MVSQTTSRSHTSSLLVFTVRRSSGFMKRAFTPNAVWHMSASIELLTADQRYLKGFSPFSLNGPIPSAAAHLEMVCINPDVRSL